MGSKGAMGHLGIAPEVTWGTPIAATKYLKLSSESMVTTIEELISASLSGKRDEPDQYQGAITNAGDTSHEFHPNDMGMILKSWFGSCVSTLLATGVYQHYFTPVNTQFSTNCELPPYTLEIQRDIGNSHQYAGCVANNLNWTFGVGTKILQLVTSWLAKSVTTITKTSPSFEATDPYLWLQSIIGIGTDDTGTAESGTATTLVDTGKTWTPDAYINKYIRITAGTGIGQVRKITDNDATSVTVATWGINPGADSVYEIYTAEDTVENMNLVLSNGLVGYPTLNQTREISRIVGDSFRMGTIAPTFHTQNLTQWDRYVAFTSKAWIITFQAGAITGNWKYEIEFQFPKVVYTAMPINIAGPGRIVVAANGKIKYDTTSGYACRIRLVNSTASY